jgi:hypothetical protein
MDIIEEKSFPLGLPLVTDRSISERNDRTDSEMIVDGKQEATLTYNLSELKENNIDKYRSSDPTERRRWELCEKPKCSHNPLSLVWNYFLVYKYHLDFPAAVCKICYYRKKVGSSCSSTDWECCFPYSSKAPKRLEAHLRNNHPELFQQLKINQEENNKVIQERRTWEICEKQGENNDRIWNYFCVYKDHPEFPSVICKTCYNKKKVTMALPSSWEHRYGSCGPNPATLAYHLQVGHPQVFEEYKNNLK